MGKAVLYESNAMRFDNIAEYLKAIIDDEGIDYLSREPYEAYQYLANEMQLDGQLCRSVLSALLAGAVEKTLRIHGVKIDDNGKPVLTDMSGVIEESALIPAEELDRLSKWIQKECFFKKNVADELAEMFLSLFSAENMTAWASQSEYGFREFCEGEWEYKFHGKHTWHHGGGTVDCWVDIEVDFTVEDAGLFREMVAVPLSENPFLKSDAIFDLVSRKLDKLLQHDMVEYIEGETYYTPYMEDYRHEAEYALKDFCKKYGLCIEYFECDGTESDIEPDSRW